MRTVRFEFDTTVPLAEAELTLDLARYSAEGLVGQARVQLDVAQRFDRDGHAIVVEGEGEAFESVVRVFVALLIREFGENGFRVRRVEHKSGETPTPDAAPQQAATAPAAA